MGGAREDPRQGSTYAAQATPTVTQSRAASISDSVDKLSDAGGADWHGRRATGRGVGEGRAAPDWCRGSTRASCEPAEVPSVWYKSRERIKTKRRTEAKRGRERADVADFLFCSTSGRRHGVLAALLYRDHSRLIARGVEQRRGGSEEALVLLDLAAEVARRRGSQATSSLGWCAPRQPPNQGDNSTTSASRFQRPEAVAAGPNPRPSKRAPSRGRRLEQAGARPEHHVMTASSPPQSTQVRAQSVQRGERATPAPGLQHRPALIAAGSERAGRVCARIVRCRPRGRCSAPYARAKLRGAAANAVTAEARPSDSATRRSRRSDLVELALALLLFLPLTSPEHQTRVRLRSTSAASPSGLNPGVFSPPPPTSPRLGKDAHGRPHSFFTLNRELTLILRSVAGHL